MSETRLDSLKRMAEARPQDPRIRFGLAVELLKEGRTREGAEALRAYLESAEDEGNGWGRLGDALAELGDLEGAREAYGKGIAKAKERGHDGLKEELEEARESLG
jgi:predicted Zn-dependent protease